MSALLEVRDLSPEVFADRYGKTEGFETNERGFALSGPVYYKRFRDTCLDMIRRFGINQFLERLFE